jgi:hypothetical protein
MPDGSTIVWNGSAWVPAGEASAAAPKPRPEYGPNAVELPNGEIWRTRRDGGLADRISGGTNEDGTDPTAAKADAAQRGRIQFALDPVTTASRYLDTIEAGNRNPFSQGSYGRGKPVENFFDAMGNTFAANTVRAAADEKGGGPWAQTLAAQVGGEDFQLANQAYSSFEASLIPIFAGSAVTASEASRFLKANVPVPGETAEVVRRKRVARQQLANAASRIAGVQIPFPDVPTVWPAGFSAAAAREFEASMGGAPAQPQRTPQTPASRAPAPGQPQRQQAAQRPTQSRWTQAQQQAVRQIPGGPRGQRGSRTNPVLIRNDADFDALRPGQIFVTPDGKLRQK